jgi:glycosyltransferase involved in cell wall biosynthesis
MAQKVLFITYKLQNYRIPIFDIIGNSKNIELTIAHSSKKSEYKGPNFKEIIIPYKKLGIFTYYGSYFKELVKQYDVVVCMFYLFNLSFLRLALKRSTKLIFWGIGVRASYNAKFDSPTIMNRIRYFLAKRSDAMLFYSDYAKDKYINHGIEEEKLFVMPNTVKVLSLKGTKSIRENILFIGSLYKQKKIFELLESYKAAVDKYDKKPNRLHIVGGGAEYENVQKWIMENKLKNNIVLHGAIFEESILSELFGSAYACISPGQAGLSVLKSFGYGVPFITHKDAITGGERLNIQNNVNGILFDNYSELTNIILDMFENPQTYIAMGANAKQFYDMERTPTHMANGFLKAVEYLTDKK